LKIKLPVKNWISILKSEKPKNKGGNFYMMEDEDLNKEKYSNLIRKIICIVIVFVAFTAGIIGCSHILVSDPQALSTQTNKVKVYPILNDSNNFQLIQKTEKHILSSDTTEYEFMADDGTGRKQQEFDAKVVIIKNELQKDQQAYAEITTETFKSLGSATKKVILYLPKDYTTILK
jgi:hypothetical protein